jgi:hypothetical protein
MRGYVLKLYILAIYIFQLNHSNCANKLFIHTILVSRASVYYISRYIQNRKNLIKHVLFFLITFQWINNLTLTYIILFFSFRYPYIAIT